MFTELCEEPCCADGGLEEDGLAPADAGRSGLDREALDVLLMPLTSEDRFAGVMELVDADTARFWKKPAMLCCLPEDDLCVLGVGAFFFAVPISLPSMPLAIFTRHERVVLSTAEYLRPRLLSKRIPESRRKSVANRRLTRARRDDALAAGQERP